MNFAINKTNRRKYVKTEPTEVRLNNIGEDFLDEYINGTALNTWISYDKTGSLARHQHDIPRVQPPDCPTSVQHLLNY